MTSSNNFELSNFQKQIANNIANVFNPDAQIKTLINNFINLANPTIADFRNLASSVNSVLENSSVKTKAAFAPITTLLMVKELELKLEEHQSSSTSSAGSQESSIVFASAGQAIHQCVGKPGAFTLNLITEAPTNVEEFFASRNACKSFSITKGDHWLTFTGDVDGCKGPYKSADAFYACEMGI